MAFLVKSLNKRSWGWGGTFSSCHPQLLETEGFSKNLVLSGLNERLGERGWATRPSSLLGGIDS